MDAEQPELNFDAEEEAEDEDEDIKQACEEELLREIELVASFRHPRLGAFPGCLLATRRACHVCHPVHAKR